MAFWNRKRTKPRRVERLRPEGDLSWYQRLKDRRALTQVGILAAFFAAALLIVQLPHRPLPYQVGTRTSHPIRSRVEFAYVDHEATQRVRELQALRVTGIYTPDWRGIAALRQSLLDLVAAVAEAESLEGLPKEMRETWDPDEPTFAAVKTALGPEAANLDAVKETVGKAASALAQPLTLPILGQEDFQREAARLEDIKGAIAKLPPEVLDDVQLPRTEPAPGILARVGDAETPLPLGQVLRQAESIQARIERTLAGPLRTVFGREGVEKLAAAMTRRLGPTLIYDQVTTENRRGEARAAVHEIRRIRKEGTTLVEADTLITDAQLRLLVQEEEAYQARLGLLRKATAWVGVGAVAALVVLLAAGYTARFQAGLARSTPRTLVLCLLCLLVMGASKAVAQAHASAAIPALLVTTAAMVITIAYAQTFALAATAALALLVALAVRADFDWVVTVLAGMAVAVLSLGRINNRSKLIKVGALAGAVMFAAVIGLALWRIEYTAHALWSGLQFLLAGLIAGFLMLGLLPFIERAFGIVTNISLLELCDVNQPALKRLAIEAPGTYAHSLLIGTLSEAAAEAIGASGLLARVGAYFHDIGKVNKPRYYVENWQEETGTHEGLTPQMSRLVITSHVKDGLEMADRLGLPPLIKRFIAEHHGTTLVEYFYREAERQQADSGGEAPAEEDYRYPGPKPQAPETAIVMLADAAEGAVRSLKDPTAAKIRSTVHEMIMKRLLDGQLDASGLTLSDLHRIEETLTKTLLSVYHGRVSYPAEKPAAEAEAGAKEKAEAPPAPGADAGGARPV